MEAGCKRFCGILIPYAIKDGLLDGVYPLSVSAVRVAKVVEWAGRTLRSANHRVPLLSDIRCAWLWDLHHWLLGTRRLGFDLMDKIERVGVEAVFDQFVVQLVGQVRLGKFRPLPPDWGYEAEARRSERFSAAKHSDVVRDSNAPDMIDGQTDGERGAPPDLEPRTLVDGHYIAVAAGASLDEAVYAWRASMADRSTRPRDPDANFLRFLRERIEEAGSGGVSPEPGTSARLIEDREPRP